MIRLIFAFVVLTTTQIAAQSTRLNADTKGIMVSNPVYINGFQVGSVFEIENRRVQATRLMGGLGSSASSKVCQIRGLGADL